MTLPLLGAGKGAPGGGGGSGPPATNQVLWVLSDTGLEQTSGGTLATATNDPVGRWLDQSGSAHHLLQATSGNRPTLQLSQLNGYPSLRFDGSNDFLQALFALPKPFHAFLVVKQISWSTGDNILAGASGDNYSLYQSASSPRLRHWTGTANATENPDLSVGSWGLVESLFPASGSTYLRVNNGTAISSGGSAVADRGGITLGAHSSGGTCANIDVAELLVYNVEQTGADQSGIRSYLQGRYGI